MLAALAFIFAQAAGQADFSFNEAYQWNFNSAPSIYGLTCQLSQKENYISGKCIGMGFKSEGIAYGRVEGANFYLSVHLERLNDTYLSIDLFGPLPGRDDHSPFLTGAYLTTDGNGGQLKWGAAPPPLRVPTH